ncbi:MAG: hypothetical protein EXR79_02210 [Myxococcales bacterium]|nr:hypothetical protein [Myxococcales bacterium]
MNAFATATLACTIACGVIGCAAPAPVAERPSLTVAPPQLPAAGHPHRPWAVGACKPGVVAPDLVACVDGVTITGRQLRATQRHMAAGTPVRATLQALVDAELLAAAAHAAGGWNHELAHLHAQAMVARLLRRSHEERFGPDQISLADLTYAFRQPAVHEKFSHVAAYGTTEAQCLCCQGDARECEAREDVRACIDKLEPQAERLAQRLAIDPPATGLEMTARLASWADAFPNCTGAHVDFYYDPSKPYERQKGYDLMVKPYALAVVALQPGTLAAVPIRTPFGWHVPRLDRLTPARRATLDDPAVRREIAENVVDGVRERDASLSAMALLHEAGVALYFDRLEPAAHLGAAQGSGEETLH